MLLLINNHHVNPMLFINRKQDFRILISIIQELGQFSLN